MSLVTPDKVRKLQRCLYVKAKSEPSYKFYSLWDKMLRPDVMMYAWRRVKANRGAAGVDGIDFDRIEQEGVNKWLGKLQQELREKKYLPDPLLRVWIPKVNGDKRPLSIPTIRDRVVQMCWYLVCVPIFEADLPPQQYGFRPKLDAKMAVRRIYWNVTKHGKTEVVDADLKDYFNTIPHGNMLKSVSRRVVDKNILEILKLWLTASVVENDQRGNRVITTEARDTHKGSGQGSVISPLLANIYFRRFLLTWVRHGYATKHKAAVVNYADDFVICCSPGYGARALQDMRSIMEKIGLVINEQKTKLVKLPKEPLDFLGYRIGEMVRKDGSRYIGTKPAPKSIKKIISRIHEETSIRWTGKTGQSRVDELNPVLRGWANYFNQGPVLPCYKKIQSYTYRRLQRFLAKKHKIRGRGYKQFSEEYLHEKLGLFRFPKNMAEVASAKT